MTTYNNIFLIYHYIILPGSISISNIRKHEWHDTLSFFERGYLLSYFYNGSHAFQARDCGELTRFKSRINSQNTKYVGWILNCQTGDDDYNWTHCHLNEDLSGSNGAWTSDCSD